MYEKDIVNIQTGEKLDLSRVVELKDNAMLKAKPDLWGTWDFKKNNDLGLDIWKISRGTTKKAWWICLKCNNEHCSVIYTKTKGCKCPVCSGRSAGKNCNLSTENPQLASEWHPTLNISLTPSDVRLNSNIKVWWLGKCGHEWEAQISNRNNGNGCPYCTNQKVLKGYNDIWTTNPKLASLLVNPNDGYIYTQSSHKKLDWKCVKCNRVVKDKAICHMNGLNYEIKCELCQSNRSVSERMIMSLLNTLGIEYLHDTSFNWSNKRRYDFYIPLLNCIIEAHGGQHYDKGFDSLGGRTTEEEKENDEYKYDLAIKNDVEKYIVIDCRYTDFEYIRNNILNSELKDILNLENVDWTNIIKNIENFSYGKILDLWNSGSSIDEISKLTNYKSESLKTIIKNLDKAGFCSRAIPRPSNRVYQYSMDDELIKVWEKSIDVALELGVSRNHICDACSGRKKSAKGFKWKYERDVLPINTEYWNSTKSN